MSQFCKGICKDISVIRRPKEGSMYARGFKHCSICVVFFQQEDNICKCCRTRLGTRPKTKREKDAFDLFKSINKSD